jgi:hypothetical protein
MFPDDIVSSVVGALAKLDPHVQVYIGAAAVSVLFHQRIPKVGPGRAIMLALRSYFRSGPAFASMRTRDKGALLSKLKWLKQDQFIVCKGPRGIGKTHMIREALIRTPGVVYVNIFPGTTDVDIVNRAYAAISNTKGMLSDGGRVLWWYRLLFRRSPIVVIAAMEQTAAHDASVQAGVRLAAMRPWAVPAAASSLVAAGVCVIVDSSENSILTERTLRETILHMSPLPIEVIVLLSRLSNRADPSHPHLYSRGLDSASDLNRWLFVSSCRHITTIPNSRRCSNCCALWRLAMLIFVCWLAHQPPCWILSSNLNL